MLTSILKKYRRYCWYQYQYHDINNPAHMRLSKLVISANLHVILHRYQVIADYWSNL